MQDVLEAQMGTVQKNEEGAVLGWIIQEAAIDAVPRATRNEAFDKEGAKNFDA